MILWDEEGDVGKFVSFNGCFSALAALPFLILGFPGTILAIICGSAKRERYEEDRRRWDEEEKQRKREACERCARTLSKDPAFINGCAQRIENYIRQRIQYGRAKPLSKAETEMQLYVHASSLWNDHDSCCIVKYSDFGYEHISYLAALALAYLVKAELEKRLPTIPIAVEFDKRRGWEPEDWSDRCLYISIFVDISKEVRLLKTF